MIDRGAKKVRFEYSFSSQNRAARDEKHLNLEKRNKIGGRAHDNDDVDSCCLLFDCSARRDEGEERRGKNGMKTVER